MLDLAKLSGLPLALNDDGKLAFGADLIVDESGLRLLDELAAVALEPQYCRGSQEVAYTMDNGINLRQDLTRLAGVGMRYELTLIPPRRIGREFIKTHGHRHQPDPRTGLQWPEICEVLTGTAHFLFQTLDPAGPGATMALCVEVGPGQKVVFPPGFDHCTINPGPDPVLFSDVIALGVKGNYDLFRATHGAVYLEVEDEGAPRFVPNPTYRDVPPLRRAEVTDYPELSLNTDRPLYTAFVQTRGQKWPFLRDPSQFWATFPDLQAVFGV